MKLSEEEQQAIADFIEADEAQDNANELLDEVFKKRLVPLVEAGNFSAARQYIIAMPESVAKLYAADYLRSARGDYNK